MSEASSLRSSLDSDSNVGPYPVQLSAQDAPQPSLLRRFSSATQSFFSAKSSAPQHSETFDHDFIGSHHLQQSFAAESDDESTVQAYMPDKPDDEAEQVVHEFVPADLGEGEAQGDNLVAGERTGAPLQRRRSTVATAIQTFSQKFGFWDQEFLSHRNKILATMLQNYLFILVGFTIALCIYWGVYYDRPSRYKNIQFAVVLGDSTDWGLQQLVAGFFQSPKIQTLGHFDVFNHTRIAALAKTHGISIDAEVIRQVHHQHYQAAFYVHANSSQAMQAALGSADATFSPATDLLSVYYETGSDYNAVFNYISSIVQQICAAFFKAAVASAWTPGLLTQLAPSQTAQLLQASPGLLTQVPNFREVDLLPVPQQVVQAPLQMGLIYLCMFTFFQFMFTLPIQMCVVAKLKGWRFVVFRIATSQTSYFVLSLAYVALNRSFGIRTDRTFGRSGFLVVWAFAFLTMSSVGSLIEILVLVCVVLKPAMIGLVLLMVAVSNLAPTINPIYLCPKFYRYGYAMPVPNSYHLMQVAYFNSWKGHMGRHIGVLLAWSIVTNSMMPWALKWVGQQMEKKRVAAAAAAAAEKTVHAEAAAAETVPAKTVPAKTAPAKTSPAPAAPHALPPDPARLHYGPQPVTTSAYSEAITRGTQDLHREHLRAG